MKTDLPRKRKSAVATMERSRQLARIPAVLNFNVATDATARSSVKS
ncbi:hypothetical protein SAMN04490194_0034 [Pseudomonas migulae]|uniref:Uncharacterized protein n=1 Tax=Pseudomonas migulae TaxID=78543 RepID=A0A1H4ZM69_9PSED|nr:hypothetical protein FBY04_101448 [Pseudomonas sp. SJZ080]SED31222.1 hypothetical protein SAMN04490194_0034 [Pseudomonas migulae]